MKLVEFQKVAEMLSKEHKIKFQEGRGWSANIKDRIVFYSKKDIYSLPEEHILGLLLHETAHIHYTTEVNFPPTNQEITFTTMNMIEDISIENIIKDDYPNAGEILESTREEVLDTLVKMLPKMKDTSVHEKALLYAAARFWNRGYATGILPYEILGNKVAKIMAKNRKEILERKATKDLLPIVNEIVKLLLKEAGALTEDEKREMQQNNQDGRATEDKDQEKTKGKLISQLKAATGWKGEENMSTELEYIGEIGDQANQIGKQLRSILKRNNSMEFGGRYRTGKLLAKRFVRIKIIKDRNPFTKRIIKSNQSYAFAIASDVSRSMFHGNSENSAASYAMTSMQMVGEALRYANVPRSMIIFGAKAITIAPMSKAQIRWETMADQEGLIKAENANTNIHKAIESCTQELNNVKAERKIMIVLTDGSSDLWSMKEAHKKAVNKGIECLGITIGQESCRSYMDETFGREKNITIKDTHNPKLIGKAFIDILKASIKKSP
ncbi:VWA domain-containing protein [Candidatus Woesearchaeota archaeon]|nr:VWA domain-containing protein [Candidatus Woesearchaeota archaeon]